MRTKDTLIVLLIQFIIFYLVGVPLTIIHIFIETPGYKIIIFIAMLIYMIFVNAYFTIKNKKDYYLPLIIGVANIPFGLLLYKEIILLDIFIIIIGYLTIYVINRIKR